ncbi:ABC transporter permease [Sphingomonas sp. PAMC26645]|uniref:ABC transporter permease n=1 Tax=Sphingomonas sp. PAMC26645 TaxID=2565555 RepID=UPI00109DCAE1|nr:ABC transporter permease [Sphingomonas sp. PAMC26645]QCB43276.1 ABC transporter permease [Sphingomonas sp. PAMC26645]
MNRFALIGFWRSLTRHRLYAALNIGGLALGIAVFLVLTLYVRFETGFERWLPGYQHIYLVESQTSDALSSVRARQSTPVAAWSAIKADLPATRGTRIQRADAAVVKNGVGVRERMGLVDPTFFTIFQLHAVAGALPARFDDPTAIVITRRTAEKYFGSASPIGAPLAVTFGGKRYAYRVVAVIDDLPNDTQLEFDLLAPLVISEDRNDASYVSNHSWNYGGPSTYVWLADAAAASRLAAALPGITARHVTAETPDNGGVFSVSLSLRRMTDTHFETPGATLMVTTLGIIGLLTLIVAIVNYVNLATARAGLRAREVGMRKVLGADQATLLRHFVGEAIATALIAAVFGLALAELGVPLVNAATGLELSVRYVGLDGVLLPLAVLAILVGAVAGLYPAVILSRVPAAAVLASARSPGGGRAGARTREALVIFQFTVTIALIVGTLVLVSQTRHVREADVGYDRNQLLLVRSFGSDSLDDSQRESLLHRFAALPNARGVSVGTSVPGRGLYVSTTTYPLPGTSGPGLSLERFDTIPGYFDVLGAKLIAGRQFDPARPADINPDKAGVAGSERLPANIIINRSAVRAFHFGSPQSAIGKTVGIETPRTIIGVVEDMRVYSPRDKVSPTAYLFTLRPPQSAVAMIRFSGDAKAFAQTAGDAWRREAPEVPFDARTTVQALEKLYEADDRMANLFAIGAGLAVAIGCVGLWGLASFTTARRVREIGIRKVLGASSGDVVKLLVGQFLRPVLLANLLAWPLAYVAMRAWLAGFDDRIALSPSYFIAASVLALAIAIATVLSQSIRASRATPAWALRHE